MEDLSSVLVEVADLVMNIAESEFMSHYKRNSSSNTSKDDVPLKIDDGTGILVITDIATNCVQTIFNIMLWNVKDVMTIASKLNSTSNETTDPKELSTLVLEEEDKQSFTVANIIAIRDMMIDILHTWMALKHQEKEEEDVSLLRNDEKVSNIALLQKILKMEAFRMLGDIRLLFPNKLSEYAIVRKLEWLPSHEVVAAMRNVFESVSTSKLFNNKSFIFNHKYKD